VPERSPEIEQVLRETIEAMVRSDLDEIGRRTSRNACVLSIGSDPGEWAEGYDEIMGVFRDSTPEGELGVTVSVYDAKAFCEGSVGWVASHGYFEMQGERVPVRFTAVVHQEDGEWKAVQSHASIGVPNEQMLDPMFKAPGSARRTRKEKTRPTLTQRSIFSSVDHNAEHDEPAACLAPSETSAFNEA
jgi:hypothetical protein